MHAWYFLFQYLLALSLFDLDMQAYIHTHSVDGWEGSGDNMVITTRVREKWREELVRWFRCVRNGGRNVMELPMDLFCGRTQEEISSL